MAIGTKCAANTTYQLELYLSFAKPPSVDDCIRITPIRCGENPLKNAEARRQNVSLNMILILMSNNGGDDDNEDDVDHHRHRTTDRRGDAESARRCGRVERVR